MSNYLLQSYSGGDTAVLVVRISFVLSWEILGASPSLSASKLWDV